MGPGRLWLPVKNRGGSHVLNGEARYHPTIWEGLTQIREEKFFSRGRAIVFYTDWGLPYRDSCMITHIQLAQTSYDCYVAQNCIGYKLSDFLLSTTRERLSLEYNIASFPLRISTRALVLKCSPLVPKIRPQRATIRTFFSSVTRRLGRPERAQPCQKPASKKILRDRSNPKACCHPLSRLIL